MIHFTDGGGTLAFLLCCFVYVTFRAVSGFWARCFSVGFRRWSQSGVFLCVCVFERVLSTVCWAIRSQSDVFLRVFERGFGNGLRGNWASEGAQSGVFLRVLERGFWNGLRGNWASEAVAKWYVSCVFS